VGGGKDGVEGGGGDSSGGEDFWAEIEELDWRSANGLCKFVLVGLSSVFRV